jgi:hypothetical protein
LVCNTRPPGGTCLPSCRGICALALGWSCMQLVCDDQGDNQYPGLIKRLPIQQQQTQPPSHHCPFEGLTCDKRTWACTVASDGCQGR